VKKSKVKNKRRWYMLSIVIVLILYISSFTIIDNSTFSSPESAFRYSSLEDIIFVEEGEESALVAGENECRFLTKSDTGWKLSSIGDTKTVFSGSLLNHMNYNVEQYKDSDDYYITVSDVYGCASNVADNRNSEFYREENTCDVDDGIYYTYYTYVHDLDDDYTLIVNGKEFPVVDEQN
jgi:hypothetical protein